MVTHDTRDGSQCGDSAGEFMSLPLPCVPSGDNASIKLTEEQLDGFSERVLTVQTLEEALGPLS